MHAAPEAWAPHCRPRLILRTLTRGDGLLGLRPCGPVIAPSRVPLFGARAEPVSLVQLQWPLRDGRTLPHPPPEREVDAATQQAAVQRLQACGLKPLPLAALQWRGPPALGPGESAWTLVQEGGFGDFWADELPRLQAEGWQVIVLPGFAHVSVPVEAWQLVLNPVTGAHDAHALHALAPRPPRLQALTQPPGMGSWLLSLGVVVEGETLDLVPLFATLLKRDRRWLAHDTLATIDDDALVRLRTPLGRHIDVPAAPLKVLARTLIDLLTEPRQRDGPLVLADWEARRLDTLRRELIGPVRADAGTAGAWALQGDAGLQQLATVLQQAGPPAPVPMPAGLGITLRDYQAHGLAWLQQLRGQQRGGILADDMGLGKTAQALAHLLLERQAGRLDRPALVVAPASLLFNWQAEQQRIAPALRLLLWHGPDRQRDPGAFAGHDLVLTAYPMLWRDDGLLRRQRWHLVILDEAQVVKNAGSRTATAARRLDARHRLCLTGTPIENHLGELWAQFHFLMPGYLGDARQFQRRWRTPIERNGETQRALLLAQRVAPFILRRRKAEVATELPPLTEQLQRVQLDGPQRLLYEGVRFAADEQVRRLLDRVGFRGAQVSILDALLKLRQVCCDPRLLRPLPPAAATAGSAKLDWLCELLPVLVAQGRRVLLFSQFTRWLALLRPALDSLGLPFLSLTGALPAAARGALVQRFQAGEAPLLLASLKAGGVGLNLTAADTVIHLDPWWNPAVERQAAARAHRIGQTRPVLVYRLVVQGSIEERMLALQQRKQVLADSVLGTGGVAGTHFSAKDLQALLAPLDDTAL